MFLLTLTLSTTVSAAPVDTTPTTITTTTTTTSSSCLPVTDERWRELAGLLEGLASRESVCTEAGEEGNYTGQLEGGLREGWGEMRWSNGTLYGPDNIFYYSRGDRYLGQWHRGEQRGVGTLLTQTGIYVGHWEGGLQVTHC